MTTDRNRICDIDINAYVDGELDAARACEVERHLSQRPNDAARVMEDLAGRSALRLIAGKARPFTPRAERRAGGTRLSLAAVIAFAGLSVMTLVLPNAGGQSVASPPSYLDDAMMSHRITLMRARMASQPEAPNLDVHDLMRETGIRVPRLPAGWRVLDAQLFPSEYGPALQMLVHTEDKGVLSIFAVRGASTAPTEPSAERMDGRSIAYWRKGDLSYALIGDGTPEEIDRIADHLEDGGLEQADAAIRPPAHRVTALPVLPDASARRANAPA
ncbi:anti-sigma factor family protein [Edaphosphingomonas haloaromaticamans]|uniref:Anti-sigma factor n=1 Tax=Edaphosphingomonas haloaromaticamans TaxID=653954 RepID=A0A1S1H7W5_9SPHN|nr:zf-HC2 domain-containing protein [Sphingomonas haloaromaticamans]OHT18184.1 hypothetical protein BHE75_00153 [Sphingomonas haloaromaticamans]